VHLALAESRKRFRATPTKAAVGPADGSGGWIAQGRGGPAGHRRQIRRMVDPELPRVARPGQRHRSAVIGVVLAGRHDEPAEACPAIRPGILAWRSAADK